MSNRNEILKEILSDPDLMEKYGLTPKEMEGLKTSGPYFKKIVEIMATIINENDDNRSQTMIYNTLKNIHKI
jgi:hypothetical protein